MTKRLPGLWRTKIAGATNATSELKSNPASPARLTIVCAVLLSVVVSVASGIFLSNLHDRELASNEAALSDTALIVAEQIEHIFTTVTTVQKQIIQQTGVFANLGQDGFERALSGYDFHVKLRDIASGMPYVGSLTIMNAQGHLINFSRQWPIPEIDASDRDFVKAFQSDPSLLSFVSEPVHNRFNGRWVVHLARKISGSNGEFLGLTTAAIDLEYLERGFRRISANPESGISLFRNDGALFVQIPKNESDIGRRFPAVVALKLVSATDHGAGVTVGAIGGDTRVIAAHRVGSYPVVVAATRTTFDAFANWRRTATYTIFAAALTIIAIATFAVLLIRMLRNQNALTKARADQENAKKYRNQSLILDAALNNMSQGLAMFNSSERIIFCNQGYVDMYGLPLEAVTPGRSLRELLCYRQAQGSLAGDIEKYRLEILKGLALGKPVSAIAIDEAGRSHRVVNVPMAGGGWVATHEDVTEKLRAEMVNEQQKLQLDAAFENMIQGICMFDATQRLIVCNKRYAELYRLSTEQTKPGTTLREILGYRIASGTAPEEGKNYFEDRMKEITANKPHQVITKLEDGRYLSVVHKPTDGGGWVATHEDVTAQKQAECELDETKIFLDSIIQNTPVAVVVKELQDPQIPPY